MEKGITINARKMILARYEAGLSRKSLAEQCGVNAQTIYNIENRKCGTKPEVLKKMCDVLNVRIEEVLSFD